MFPFSVSRNQEPAHPGGTIPSTFRSQGLVTFSAVYFSRILPRVFHLRTLMGFTLQSVPFREMLGSSRSRIPSCRYPSPSAVRGRSCLFPGRQDRTSRLQGFDPSRSPFAGARGLAEASGRCSPGFMPLQGVLPDTGTLTLRERASLEVPAWALGASCYPCELQLVRLEPRLPECRPIPSFLAVLGTGRLTCMWASSSSWGFLRFPKKVGPAHE